MATENLFGQTAVRSKDIGSMAKRVVLECSERQLMTHLRASGNRIGPLICVYSDRAMDKRCLVRQLKMEWILAQICNHKTNRTVRESRFGATEVITMAILRME